MCIPRAPRITQQAAPQAPEAVKPLVNPYLDGPESGTRLVNALRTGNSALRVPLPSTGSLGFGQLSGTGVAQRGATGAPSGNASITGGRRGAGGSAPRIPTAQQTTDLARMNFNATPAQRQIRDDRAEDRADRRRYGEN